MTETSVKTYADAFGVWHAEVAITGALVGADTADRARTLARAAIARELADRAPRDARPARFVLTLTSAVGGDGAVVYRFTERAS